MFVHTNPGLRKNATFLSPEWFNIVFRAPEFYFSSSIDEFVKRKESLILTTGLLKPKYTKDTAIIILPECHYQRTHTLSREEMALLQDQMETEITNHLSELKQNAYQNSAAIFSKFEAKAYEIMKGCIDAEIYDDTLTRIPIRTTCEDILRSPARLCFPQIVYSPKLPYCELIGHIMQPTTEQLELSRSLQQDLTLEEVKNMIPFVQKGIHNKH